MRINKIFKKLLNKKSLEEMEYNKIRRSIKAINKEHNSLKERIGIIENKNNTLKIELESQLQKEAKLLDKNEKLVNKNSRLKKSSSNANELESQLVEQQAATKTAEDKSAALEKQLTDQQAATKTAEDKSATLEKGLTVQQAATKTAEDKLADLGKQLVAQQAATAECKDKTSSLEKLIAKTITVDFDNKIFPAKNNISFDIHKSSDDSFIETVEFNSLEGNGFFHKETSVSDYPYNLVAIGSPNYQEKNLRASLAEKYGVDKSSQSNDYWTTKLAEDWNIVIEDQSYELFLPEGFDQSDEWSYFETTPEYTPSETLGDRAQELLIYRKSGLGSFSFEPTVSLSSDTDYYVKINEGDFKNYYGDNLPTSKFFFNISESTVLASEKKSNGVVASRALSRKIVLGNEDSVEPTFDILSLKIPENFKKSQVDKVTSFKPSSDRLQINPSLFGIGDEASFASGKNKRQVKKLAQQDFDFLYDDKKGGLYFNENGIENGFGEGGIIAILKGGPALTSESIDFF